MTFHANMLSPLGPLTALGIILALGILGGQIARKSSALPTVTGLIITGLFIGPHGLDLISQPLIDASDLFVQLALGLALFELGRRIDLHWLRRERILLLTALGSTALCFVTLVSVATWLDIPQQGAALIAALSLSCSPAILLEVLRENRAEGQMSERLVACAGIGNLLALSGYCLALAWGRLNDGQPVESYLLQPGWNLLGSATIGLLAGLAAIRLNHWIGARYRETQEVLLFALIALTVGLASSTQMLPALALLVFGLSTRNLSQGFRVASPWAMRHNVLFFTALFVIAGTQLDLHQLGNDLPQAALLVALRSGVHILSTTLMAHANGLSRRSGAYMGLALMPMSGPANLALLSSTALLPASTGSILPLTVAMLCLTELLGPPLTQLALKRSGDAQPQL